MNRIVILIPLLAGALACGEAGGGDPKPLLEKALAALGGREAVAGVESIYLRLEGTFEPGGNRAAKAPYRSEILFTLAGGFVDRFEVAGLTTTRGVADDRPWLRSGAAVADPKGAAAVEELAFRDDYLSLLVLPLTEPGFTVRRTRDGIVAARPGGPERTILFDEATGLPARIVREARGAGGTTGRIVRTFSNWRQSGPILFPTELGAEGGGGRLTLVAKEVEINPRDTRGLSLRRPVDDRPVAAGPIRRITQAGGNYLAVTHRGPLVDLAKVDRLLEQGIERSRARRKGPNRRIFHEYPDKDGVAVVATVVPVDFDRDPAAANLPPGIEVIAILETELLAMEFTGPYPRDDSLRTALANYGRDLGLTPTAQARYVILSDPEQGEPADLRQEIRLPVRRAE